MAEQSSGDRAPLAGVRILSVEQVVAMPFATQLLARLGADVVKIENPVTGDTGRHSYPMVRDGDGRLVGAPYIRSNLHKRSIGLDLKSDEGREMFLALAEHFDVVADNLRPGTLARMGLGPQQLIARYPRIVTLSISGFGSDPDSPYHSWPAYAPIAEAMAGFGEATRKPGQPPTFGGAGALGDISASLFACIGLLAALRQRDQTGQGQHVDVSMFDAMLAMADSIPSMWSISQGETIGASAPTSVVGAFLASDGYFILFARDSAFSTLAKLLGHDEWSTDPEWATPGAWKDRIESHIRPAVEEWASSRTRLEASGELGDLGIPAAPFFSAADIASDPHVKQHQMLVDVARPDGSEPPILVVGNPIKLSSAPTTRPEPRWPTLGEHTYEVLGSELNIPVEELTALASRGVISAPSERVEPPDGSP